MLLVPGTPTLLVNTVTGNIIFLSWSVPSGSEVKLYEVTWQRDISGECSDENEGSTTINGGSNSYNITELEEDSNYTITVTATNEVGSAMNDPVTVTTIESGKTVTDLTTI